MPTGSTLFATKKKGKSAARPEQLHPKLAGIERETEASQYRDSRERPANAAAVRTVTHYWQHRIGYSGRCPGRHGPTGNRSSPTHAQPVTRKLVTNEAGAIPARSTVSVEVRVVRSGGGATEAWTRYPTSGLARCWAAPSLAVAGRRDEAGL